MSITEVFANFPATTIPAGADSNSGTETWTVSSSDGFPTASTGVTQFHVADTNQTASSELILVTNMSGAGNNTWTVTRGAEGTNPVPHEPGFTVTAVITAGWLNGVSGSTLPEGTPGALLYASPADAAAWLAGPTSGKQFLTSTGSGGTANTPAWGTIAAGDVPVLNQNTTGTAATAGNITGVAAVPNGGTGGTAVTAYAVVTGGTSATSPLQHVASLGTAGQVLTSGSSGTLPSWQSAPVDWLNVVTGYGATGNGKRSFHGAMTSGGSTLSISTDTLFTAGDVGKIVMVDGAGGTNIPLSGTISAFTNSSTVTLNTTASATVSGMMVYWGTDDTAAIQAAISAAKTTGTGDSVAALSNAQIVFLPNGIYMISSALIPQQSRSFSLTGDMATIVGASSAIIDFQGAGHLLEGVVMIDGIWFEGCGGHIFQNANIHGEVTIQRCNFVQRNVGYGIWYQDDVVNSTSTALYKATFRDITYWQGSGTRSVELWHFLTQIGANLTDITFENVNGPNVPGAGPSSLDNTQYQFYLGCNDSGGITNIAWRNCLTASSYGGYVKLQGARDVVIDGLDIYNTYITSVTNDFISIGKNAQSLASRYITIRNITRNNALGTGSPPPPYDISFDASTFQVCVQECSGQSPFCINLNGCANAALVNNGTIGGAAATIANPATDTIVIGSGKVTLGGYPIQNYGQNTFGDGSDGTATLDGTATTSWASKASSTYTMTRDCFCTNLTVNSGVTLIPTGYRIFCQGAFSNAGTVQSLGNNASGATGGTANYGTTLILGGQAGASGGTGAGAQGTGVGTRAGVGTSGAGGSGASGSGGASRSQNGGVTPYRVPDPALATMLSWNGSAGVIAGAGGAGSGGGDGSNSGGGGGGGGGLIIIFAYSAVNTGTITVAGGIGGTPAAGNCGGGGGGGGGVILVYTLTAWTAGTTSVAGGSAGAGTGSGTTGSVGTAGSVLNAVLT